MTIAAGRGPGVGGAASAEAGWPVPKAQNRDCRRNCRLQHREPPLLLEQQTTETQQPPVVVIAIEGASLVPHRGERVTGVVGSAMAGGAGRKVEGVGGKVEATRKGMLPLLYRRLLPIPLRFRHHGHYDDNSRVNCLTYSLFADDCVRVFPHVYCRLHFFS